MTREFMIANTIKAISQLPDDKAKEISDFADFIIKQYEAHQIAQGIQKMTTESKAFDFLNSEEDLYSTADLKEVYNG